MNRIKDFRQAELIEENAFISSSFIYTAFFAAATFVGSFAVNYLVSVYRLHTFVYKYFGCSFVISTIVDTIVSFYVVTLYTSALSGKTKLSNTHVYAVSLSCLCRSFTMFHVIYILQINNLLSIFNECFLEAVTIFLFFGLLGNILPASFNYSNLSCVGIALLMSVFCFNLVEYMMGAFNSFVSGIISLVAIVAYGLFITGEVKLLKRYYEVNGANNAVSFLAGYRMFDQFCFILLRLIRERLRAIKR